MSAPPRVGPILHAELRTLVESALHRGADVCDPLTSFRSLVSHCLTPVGGGRSAPHLCTHTHDAELLSCRVCVVCGLLLREMGATESSLSSKEAKVKVEQPVRKIVEEEAYVARFKVGTGEPIACGLKGTKFPKGSIASGAVKTSIGVIGIEATTGTELSGFMVVHTRSHMAEQMDDVMNNVMGAGPVMYRLSTTDGTIRVAIFQRPAKYTIELEVSVDRKTWPLMMDCRKLTIDWILAFLSKKSGGNWQRESHAQELELFTP